MLQDIDLSVKLGKQEYKQAMPELELKIGELQRQARLLKLPVIIVFEGWGASGKGTLINRLILPLDPRGFKVYPILRPNEEERLRPFLWRFWTKTPAKGRIAIFDRSWYRRVLVERIERSVSKEEWNKAYQEINSFERQLAEDGNVIIKFWLHISKKEQKKRFAKLEADDKSSWRVTAEDWEHHRQYRQYLLATEEMIERTNTHYAPWTVVEAKSVRFATVKVFETAIRALTNKIEAMEANRQDKPVAQNKSGKPSHQVKARQDKSITSLLGTVDLSKTISKKNYETKLAQYQKELRSLEYEIYLKRIPVIILCEGWDAAGKGGNIKRLTGNLDPRGYEVIPIGAPNDIEKAHHYLWRFWNHIPKAGHITIFDRTWYGRVLVERIEGFCSDQDWKKAYQEINEMEEDLTNFGTVLVKFWLHISKEEQTRRFEEREQTPHKKWKITEEDYRNREKWDAYKEAVDEMLLKTGTTYAPWTIVESESKYYARIKTLKTVIDAVSKRL
jgi:polyphosphate:AMP phosphotransferase